MAKRVEINAFNPQPRLIEQAVQVLRKGGVIAYPTDTMYGIGCDIFQQKAVKRIHQLKNRPKNKPFSFMCSSLKNISEYGHVSNTAYRMLRKNLPGAYTFVLPGTKLVPKIMLSRQKTVGIRVPDHPVCQALIKALGNPILNTSATTEESGALILDGFDVGELFRNRVDFILDAGEVYPNPSTVVSLVSDQPEILREGQGDPAPFL